MAGLDIICIGAINYDYMFHCTGLDLVETSAGGGDENLSNPISDVENDIQELAIKGKEYTTQIGGSAFITLKVAKHILPNLQVAYVGVCGTPSPFDLRFGKTNDIDAELAHLMRVAAMVAKSENIVESGFRVVSNCGDDAQQTVKHLHLHVLGGKKMDGQMA